MHVLTTNPTFIPDLDTGRSLSWDSLALGQVQVVPDNCSRTPPPCGKPATDHPERAAPD